VVRELGTEQGGGAGGFIVNGPERSTQALLGGPFKGRGYKL